MAQDNDITYCRIPADAAQRWKVVRDICAGDQALRNDDYLPYLNRMDTSAANVDRNKAYRARAVFYPATGFTLAGSVGMAFRRDPVHELPQQLEYLLTDADGAGVSVYQQSQAVLGANVQIGRHGLYTDFSSALKRPIVKSYRAEDIINWDHSLVGGKTVLSLVVLREDAQKRDGYAIETVDQWRELFLTEQGFAACRLWQIGDNGAPVIVQMEDAEGKMVGQVILRSSGAPLDEIPFDFIGSQNNDANIDDSPLYGLAQVNAAHFRNSADYEDSVFFVGQAQPTINGLTEEWRDWLEKQGQMYIGSRTPMLLPVGGKFEFAQALPNMLAKEAMDQKEAQMVALGARLIDKAQATKTATQAEGEREASTSILAMCVANVSEAYQSQIRRCARYLDLTLPDDVTLYGINQDFASVSSEPQTITALVAAWQSGAIALPDLRNFFRRQGTVSPDRTDEQIDADLKLQPAPDDEQDIDPATGKPKVVAEASPVPAVDFAPLLASIGALVDAIGKPEAPKEADAPIDFTPLIAAMRPVDLAPIVEAMRAQAEAFRAIPAPVVNYQAGDVNVTPPAINFETGSIAVNPAGVTVEGSTVNLPPAPEPAQAESWQEIEFIENEAGVITGARKKKG